LIASNISNSVVQPSEIDWQYLAKKAFPQCARHLHHFGIELNIEQRISVLSYVVVSFLCSSHVFPVETKGDITKLHMKDESQLF
jgi:hypothetical protein